MPEQTTAIVTGAGRGIGAAVASRLAADGMQVAVWDLDEEAIQSTVAELESAGVRAMGVHGDVTREDHVRDGVAQVATTLGPPTVLVNNAGVLRDNMLFKMTTDDWDVVMNVHLRGAFLMSRAVQAHMVEQRWGRIISMSSSSALGNRGQSNYSAAKAGLQGLTKTLALELGPFGITANAIAPGFIQTDMTAATAARIGRPFEDLIAEASAQTPVRRVGQPADVAAAVSFFARPDSGFVTGQVLYVTGGTH